MTKIDKPERRNAMNQKQWEPLTTAEAVIEAIKAGRHVEFTACGCDYDLPAYPVPGSSGWIVPDYETHAGMLSLVTGPEGPTLLHRYRALIAPAQPAADELRGGAVEPAGAVSATAQKIAERVPLPEPSFQLKWKDGAYYVSKPRIDDTPCYTAAQMEAHGLAVAEESLRGAEAVARKLEVAMCVLKYAYGNTSGKLHNEVSKAIDEIGAPLTAPPAGSVEVTDEMRQTIRDLVERLTLAHISAFIDGTGKKADAASDRAYCKSVMVEARVFLESLTAALQEPDNG